MLFRSAVEWKCIVGNLKKWKNGVIKTTFIIDGSQCVLTAKMLQQEGEAWRIRFEWDYLGISFGEVIESIGHIPLPPYINRDDEPEDMNRYQTVYSTIRGSVAAPTAGLHFTDSLIERLKDNGIHTAELTLHVGAGTFQPIKSKSISDHEMHCEHIAVSCETIETLREYHGKIIPVGTTSVRTIESLYWLGVQIINNPLTPPDRLYIGQWEAYDACQEISAAESMEALLNYLKLHNIPGIRAATTIIIVPGYKFRMVNGIITNFHQPRSTLLLLISAFVGNRWKEIYSYAIEKKFRFLSYGDCSLLFREPNS